MKPLTLILVGALAAVTLTGCAGSTGTASATETSTQSSASATISPTPSPTPTPVESSTVATAIALSTTELRILGADGTELDSLDFFVRADATTVRALTDAIGSEPTVTTTGVALVDHTTYEWPGLTMSVNPADSAGGDSEYGDWSVLATSATVGSVTVASDTGVGVGSTRAAVEAAGGVFSAEGAGATEGYLRLGVVSVPRVNQPLDFCFYLSLVGGTVSQLSGPSLVNLE
jgi:hypothetical protein